jgi:hypothetical protein
MTSRALVFIEDPGAANFLLPVLPALEARGIAVVLRAAGAAVDYIAQRLGPVPARPEADAETLLRTLKPDVVLVGTSENEDTLGLALVARARALGIPSVGAVDVLANADHRFRGRGAAPLAFAPDVILTADDATRAAFVALGHAPECVVACGHPHYDAVLERARVLDAEGRPGVRRRCLPAAGDRMVLAFVAEVSTGLNPAQYRKSSDYTLHGRGGRCLRTEIVLEELIDGVAALPVRPFMVLRLHPKTTRAEFADFLPAFDAVSDAGAPLDLVYAADVVAGMSSMLLFEAALLGRPTLAVLPREVERTWLPAGAEGVVAVATTREALRRQLAALLAGAEPGRRPDVARRAPAAQRAAEVIAALRPPVN